MIEPCLHDVAVQAPKDDPGKWLASGQGEKLGIFRVLLLKEVSGDRVLPMPGGPLLRGGITLAVSLLSLGIF
jgi:hypothetical protein